MVKISGYVNWKIWQSGYVNVSTSRIGVVREKTPTPSPVKADPRRDNLFLEETAVIVVPFSGAQWEVNECKRSDRLVAQNSGGNSSKVLFGLDLLRRWFHVKLRCLFCQRRWQP
jgi:hypothetical protein